MKAARSAFVLGFMALLMTTTLAHADIGWRGWGPRVGVADDPDQVIGGVHFDLGTFAPHVFFRPSVEMGIGDDVISVLGNAAAYYMWENIDPVKPYAGGQVVAAWFNPDHGDSETEVGVDGIGGIELTMDGGTRFHTEIQAGFGDIHDFKLMAGWTFGGGGSSNPKP